MEIYTTMLLDDESLLALESFNENNMDNNSNSLLKKISRQLRNFAEWLYRLIVKLINNLTSLFNRTNKSMHSLSSKVIISDPYGYVDCIEQGTSIIALNYSHLKSIRRLDMNIVKDASLMDALKEKMKDMTYGSKPEMTTRQYYEDIHRHFKESDDCFESMDKLLKDANENKTHIPIKRYQKDGLEKKINIPLKKIIACLNELKDDVENAKQTYEERNFLYRKFRKQDIERNNKLLNYSAKLIEQAEGLKELYIKLISYVEEDVTN